MVINSILQNLSILTIAKFTTSSRNEIRKQTIVKKMRATTMCSAFGKILALSNLLGTCIVQMQSVRIVLHAQKDFPIFSKEQLSMSWMLANVSREHYSYHTANKFLFLEDLSRVFYFRTDAIINSRCYWRCVLSNMTKMKSVITFQPTKLPDFTTVKIRKSSLTC